MRFRPLLALSLLAVAALPVTITRGAPAQPRYTVTDMGTLGGAESEADGINNSGLVLGSADLGRTSSNGNPISHAFVWRDAVMQDLGVVEGPDSESYSEAHSINDAGAVVGTDQGVAFLWTPQS